MGLLTHAPLEDYCTYNMCQLRDYISVTVNMYNCALDFLGFSGLQIKFVHRFRHSNVSMYRQRERMPSVLSE